MPRDLSHIKSIDDLKREKEITKLNINEHEWQLRKKFQQLPAEIAAAGVNNFIPPPGCG